MAKKVKEETLNLDKIGQNNWTLVPSKYIEFIDHDLEIEN